MARRLAFLFPISLSREYAVVKRGAILARHFTPGQKASVDSPHIPIDIEAIEGVHFESI